MSTTQQSPIQTNQDSRLSVGMLSLGCPKTLVDSELALGILDPARYKITNDVSECDVALLNTCTFIDTAKQESVDCIMKLIDLKKQGKIKALVVLGCLVQRYAKDLQNELTEVDAFLGTGDYEGLNQILDRITATGERTTTIGNPGFLYTAAIGRIPLTPLYSRYIKISEGCDHACSFCTIPSFRGKHRSREMDDIVKEAQKLIHQGAKEIILTGQDTTYFGRDTHKKFLLPELLSALNEVEGTNWIRLLYLYPSFVNQNLIEAIATLKHVCHYVDMPLQHISDSMLTSMKRGTTKKTTYELLERLRNRIPDLAIRTTFIVGYPGETEKDFEELLAFIQWAKFERLGIFKYSQEEGTKAGELKGQVSRKIKEKRFDQAMRLQQEIAAGFHNKLIGKTFDVLLERKDPDHASRWIGRTYMDAPEIDGSVFVELGSGQKNTVLQQGDFVRCKINNADTYDLFGQFSEKVNS